MEDPWLYNNKFYIPRTWDIFCNLKNLFLPEDFPQLFKVHWNKDPVPPVFSFPQLGVVEEIVGQDDPAHPAHLGEGDVQLVGGVAVLQTDLGNKGRY